MRESLKARLRNLSGVVERGMQGEAGACTNPVALADWVYEETQAIVAEAVADERAWGEALLASAHVPTQPS